MRVIIRRVPGLIITRLAKGKYSWTFPPEFDFFELDKQELQYVLDEPVGFTPFLGFVEPSKIYRLSPMTQAIKDL